MKALFEVAIVNYLVAIYWLCLCVLTVCNVTHKSLYGVIESPNFPGPYPNNRNCLWTIAAPRGNQIKYSFSHFEVEDRSQPYVPSSQCTYDYVEVIKHLQ